MLNSSVLSQPLNSKERELPCVLILRKHLGEPKPLIVLFTGRTEGVVLSTDECIVRKVGDKEYAFIEYTSSDWVDFNGVIQFKSS